MKKGDWYKKLKKKPKTEEEENKDMDDLKAKICHGLVTQLVEHKIEKAESEVELEKTKWLLDNHLEMNESMYDELYRKESLLDTDISGRDIILRLDLDVPLSPYTPPPEVVKEKEDQSKSQIHGKT